MIAFPKPKVYQSQHFVDAAGVPCDWPELGNACGCCEAVSLAKVTIQISGLGPLYDGSYERTLEKDVEGPWSILGIVDALARATSSVAVALWRRLKSKKSVED